LYDDVFQFRLNEFEMMEMVDDEEYEKLLSSKKSDEDVKDEATAVVGIPEAESDTGGKKDEDNEGTNNRSGERKTCTYRVSKLELLYTKGHTMN
jgi:hypothetical protein